MSVNYCPHCGASIDDPSAQFCPSCGAAIVVAETPAAEEPQPPPAVPPPPSVPEEQVVYAGFGNRLIAYIIDVIILAIISAVISTLFFPIARFGRFFGVWGLITWVIAFLYFWGLEAYNNGQTIGKMALKLRAVDEYSLTVAPPGNYVINNLSRGFWWIIVDFIIGILANRDDEKKRLRILQNLSKTVVISEKETT